MVSVEETVGLTVGSITMAPGAYSQFEQSVANASAGGVEKGVGKSEKVNNAIGKMFQVGFQRVGRTIKATADEIDRQNIQTQQTISALQEKLRNENDAAKRQEIAREIRANKQINDKNQEALNLRLKHEMEAAERHVELLERADERSQKSWYKTSAEVSEKLGTGVENISGVLTSGGIDPAALTQGLAEGIGGLGDMLAGKLAQAGMGEAAAALATSAAAIAGAAAAFGAIVAVMAMAYNQTLELNEEITSTIAPIDLLSGSTRGLNETLKTFRTSAMDLSMATRLETKEVIQAMGAWNAAGISMQELSMMTGGYGDNIARMVGVTQSAILASKGLGLEISEFAEFTKNLAKLGGSILDVQGAFGLISAGAEKAGMRTKDFFTAVNEASTGMSLYNFRLDDTVGLFTTLTKTLGEDLAKEKLGLEKAYQQMGFQERYQTVLSTGAERTKGILEADAQKQAEAFAETFSGVGGLSSIQTGGAIDIEKLGKYSEKEFQTLLTYIKGSSDKQTDLAKQQLSNLYTLTKGSQGKGASGIAMGFGGMSKLGEIAMDLSKGMALTKGKSLSEAAQDPVLRMFLEQQMGMSGEQLEANIRLDRELRANFKKMQDEGTLGKDADFLQELTKGTLTNDEDMKKIAERNYTEAERLGMQTLEATKSVANVLGSRIAQLLEMISGFVEYIAQLLADWFGGDTAAEQQSRLNELQMVRDQAIEAQDKITAKEEEIKDLKEKLKAQGITDSPILDELEMSARELRSEYTNLREQQKVLAAGGSIEAAQAAGRLAVSNSGQIMTSGDVAAHNRVLADIETMKNMGRTDSEIGATLNLDAATLASITGQGQMGGIQLTQGSIGTGSTMGIGVVPDDWKKYGFSTKEELAMAKETEFGGDIITAMREGFQYVMSGEGVITQSESERLGQEQLAAQQKLETVQESALTEAQDSTKALEEILKRMKSEDMISLSALSGVETGQLGNYTKAELIKKITDSTTGTAYQKAAAIEKLKGVEDFIYRGDGISGTITPIDKKDDFFGAKPGGAIDKAVNGGGIVINISGVGNAEEVARAVAGTLKRMGYGNAKMYKN